MRPSVKEVDKQVEIFLEDELILTVDRCFAKSELISWDVASKEDFLERFWPLEERYALRVALIKLSRRALHTEQVKSLLQERHFSEGAIWKAIEELKRLGTLNDEDFESHFVQKHQRLGKSRHQILQKAKSRGISAKKLATHFGPEEDTLKKLIEKRYPILLQKDAEFLKKQKAMNALYRRGFSYSAISCLLKDFNV